MAYKYSKPKPLTPDGLVWFEAMMRLQVNAKQANQKLPKKKKPKDKKR